MVLSDLAITVLPILGLFGGILVCGVVFYWAFSRMARGAEWVPSLAGVRPGRERSEPSPAPPAAPPRAPDPVPAAAPRSYDAGQLVTCEFGDEYRYGWYVKIYLLKRPITGVEQVETMHGSAELGEDERLLVIHDLFKVVALDRWRDRGVTLSRREGYLTVTIQGPLVRIDVQQRDTKVVSTYALDFSSEEGIAVPHDWPWQVQLLP